VYESNAGEEPHNEVSTVQHLTRNARIIRNQQARPIQSTRRL
jgi:hypothetical protein